MARFSDSNTNYVLSGILTPLDSEDAANKQYVDDLIAGLDDSETTYTFSFDTETRMLKIVPSSGDSEFVYIPQRTMAEEIGVFSQDTDGLVPGPNETEHDTDHFLAGDGTWRHVTQVTKLFVSDTEFINNIVNNFDTEDINNIYNRISRNSANRFENDSDGLVPAPNLGTDSDSERFFLNASGEWEKLDIEYIEGIIGDPGTLVTSADYTITSNAPAAGQVQLRRASDSVIDTDTDFSVIAQYVLRPANEQQRTLLERMAVGSKLRVLSTSPVGAGYYTLTGMSASGGTYTLTSTGTAAHFTTGTAVQGSTVEFSLKPATFDILTGNSVVFNTIVNDHLVDNAIRRNKVDFGGEHPTAGQVVSYDSENDHFLWIDVASGNIEGLSTVDSDITVLENYRLVRHDSDLNHFGPHSYIDRSFADAQYQRKIARGNTLDITQFGTSVSTSGVVAQTTSGTGNSISTSTGGWGFSTANNSNLTGSISWVSSTPSSWSDIGTNATYQYFVFKQAGSPPGGLFAALYEGINNQPVRVWMYADAENWGLFDWPIHDVNSNGTGANNIQGTRNYPLVLVASRGNPSANMRVGLNIQNSGGTAAHLDVVVPVNERNWYLGADEAWHDGYDVFGRVADITENTHLIGNLQDTLTDSWGLFPRVELLNDVYGPLDYNDFAIGDSDITITYLPKDDQFWLAIDSEIKAGWDVSARGQAAIDLHTFYYDSDTNNFIERRISADFGRDTYNRLLPATSSVDTDANTFTLRFNNQSTNNIRVLDENGNAIGNPQDEDYREGYFNKFVVYSNATTGNGIIIDHNDFANIGEQHHQYADNHDDRILITRPGGISAYSIGTALQIDTDTFTISVDTDYITAAGIDTDTVLAGEGISVKDTDTGVVISADGIEFTLRQDTDVTFGTLAAVRWDSDANEITFVESDPYNNLIPDTNHLNRSDGAGTSITTPTGLFTGITTIDFTAGTTFANAMAALPASTRQAGIVWEFSLVDVDGSEVNFDIAGNHVTAPGGGVAISFNRAMAVLRGTSEAITALSPGILQATSSVRVYTPGSGSERTFRNITIPTIQDVFDSESTGLVPAPGAARYRADQYLAGNATWHNGYDSFGRAGDTLENTHRISNLESRLHDGVGLWDARLDDDSEIIARSDFSDIDVTNTAMVLTYYEKDQADWVNIASTLNTHWNASGNNQEPGVIAFHFRFYDVDSEAFVHRRIDMFFKGSESSDNFVFVNTDTNRVSFEYDTDVIGGIALYNEQGDAIAGVVDEDFGRGYIDHIVVYGNSQDPSAGPILVTSNFGPIGYPNYPYRTFGSGNQFLQIRYDATNQQPYLHGIIFDTDSFAIDSEVETIDKTLLITDTDAERIVRKIDLAGSASGAAAITYSATGDVETVPRYIVERDGSLTLYTRRVVTHTTGSLSGFINRLEYYRGAYNAADTSNLVGVKTFVYDGSGNILRSPITAT